MRTTPLQGRPVIVVDDDDDVREAIREALTGKGTEVYEARNGREALPLLQQHRARQPVLLTDIVMPQLDGLTLIEHLKNHLRDVRPTVVVMTASNLKPSSGEYSLLKKPFRVSDFFAAVDESDTNAPTARRS